MLHVAFRASLVSRRGFGACWVQLPALLGEQIIRALDAGYGVVREHDLDVGAGFAMRTAFGQTRIENSQASLNRAETAPESTAGLETWTCTAARLPDQYENIDGARSSVARHAMPWLRPTRHGAGRSETSGCSCWASSLSPSSSVCARAMSDGNLQVAKVRARLLAHRTSRVSLGDARPPARRASLRPRLKRISRRRRQALGARRAGTALPSAISLRLD